MAPPPVDGAAAAAPSAGGGATGAAARPLGVQLYTVRALMEKDMPGTLRQLGEIGFKEVEFAGYFDRPAKEVRTMLDQAGLTAPSAHVPLDALRKSLAKVADDAAAVGHRIVICPYLEAPKTVDGWRKLADEFNTMATTLRQRDLQFAYHNHDFEFTPVAGTVPYDVLLERTDRDLVKMELDLFWATKAGRDPLTYFARYPGRFPAVHVKDMRGIRGAQEMTEVGAGEIDFGRVFARAAEGGVQHFIVEHDNPADPLASVRTSYGNLRRLLA